MRLRKKSSSNDQNEVEPMPKIIYKRREIKFYSLLDIVKAERIITEVRDGNLVFLNIARITPYPDRKKQFLESLKSYSDETQATLRMVSDDTIMVAPPEVPIEIRSLSPIEITEATIEKKS